MLKRKLLLSVVMAPSVTVEQESETKQAAAVVEAHRKVMEWNKVPTVRDSMTAHLKKGACQRCLKPTEIETPRPMKPKKNSNVAVTGQMSRAWISLSRDLSSLLGWHCVPGMLAIEAE
jgi:hypothetical protein